MPNIKQRYWTFYLMGRDKSRLPERPEFDEDDCDKMVAEGGDFREYVRKQCEASVKTWATERRASAWKRENSEEILAAGGDAGAAWAAYLAGVTDEIAHAGEAEALESLESVVLDEGGEE